MKLFISWSGEVSRLLAESLREWLPSVIQAVEPWMSGEDIGKGARWGVNLISELASTTAGIICVTPDNLDSPWVNFEAGALSRTIEATLVCPYLLGMKPTDLRGPLVQFQAAEAEKDDTRRLIKTLNIALGDNALPDKQLEKAFEVWWPELCSSIERISEVKISPPMRRPDHEVLEEMLTLLREQARHVQLGERPEQRRGSAASGSPEDFRAAFEALFEQSKMNSEPASNKELVQEMQVKSQVGKNISTAQANSGLIDEAVWERIAPLLPKKVKPQGGRARIPDRAVLSGIVFILRNGIHWDLLPKEIGFGSGFTCRRRLQEWQRAGIWKRMQRILIAEFDQDGRIDWRRAEVNSSQQVPTPRSKQRR
jgi:transposase